MSSLFELSDDPIQIEAVVAKVTHPHAGAINTFIGTVRELTDDKVTKYLYYEAYRPMALKKMSQIGEEIIKQWPQARIAITHRVGKLNISDIAVVIACSTPHRSEAFEACRYAIERMKQMVPIWKKEYWQDGSFWVGDQQETTSYKQNSEQDVPLP